MNHVPCVFADARARSRTLGWEGGISAVVWVQTTSRIRGEMGQFLRGGPPDAPKIHHHHARLHHHRPLCCAWCPSPTGRRTPSSSPATALAVATAPTATTAASHAHAAVAAVATTATATMASSTMAAHTAAVNTAAVNRPANPEARHPEACKILQHTRAKCQTGKYLYIYKHHNENPGPVLSKVVRQIVAKRVFSTVQ